MFHSGPINTAITTAVGADKTLVFFVTDEGAQSNQWENVFLKNDEVLPLLQKSAVILRLLEGSNEAAFLCAFCPAQKAPYIAIVKNGALLTTIPHTTTTQPNFTSSIHSIFPPPPTAPALSATAALFAERKARLEAQAGARQAREEAERLARRARERARLDAEPERARYIAEQKKIMEADAAERRRILMLVENDKVERRERAQRGKIVVAGKEEVKEGVKEKKVAVGRNVGTWGEISIAFRLLDGNTLKKSFESRSKLADVRKWLDVNRTDYNAPYTFQQILPNKELSAADEQKSLTELGFAHATTLVLINKNLGTQF